MKREEGVVIVYMLKWQCSFKESGSSHRLVNTIASWSCPGSNSGLLGSWTARKASALECNVETWTRDRPAGAKHGGRLLPIRLETGDRRPCTLRGKGIVFGPCILKLGFCSATYWAHVNGRDFSELSSFMMFLFTFNVV